MIEDNFQRTLPMQLELARATQSDLSRMVVRAVHGRMSKTEAADTFGVSLRAVCQWMKLSRKGVD
jgi:transposase